MGNPLLSEGGNMFLYTAETSLGAFILCGSLFPKKFFSSDRVMTYNGLPRRGIFGVTSGI